MIEQILFYLILTIVICLSFGVAFTIIRMWYQLKKDLSIKKGVTYNKIELGKLKKQVRELTEGETFQELPAESSGIPNLSNMTIEQAAESLGIPPDQLNNPLIRPLAEKIFNQIKAKQSQNPEEDINTGY